MNRRPWKILGLVPMLGLVALAAWSPTRADDDEEVAIRREEARRSFVENCLMCHGEDMTSRQRLTTKQWTAEVEKMTGWGAPLPAERKQPLIDYLAETYPSTKPAAAVERISVENILAEEKQPTVKPLPEAKPAQGAILFATHCAVCHGSGAKGGEQGTNLVEKPVLLQEVEFRAVIKDGRRKMPGFGAILDQSKQADLLAWLRKLK